MKKQLLRIKQGSMICGVCNGIAQYLEVDPNVVRLGFVALTCLGGAGIIIYIAAAVILPEG